MLHLPLPLENPFWWVRQRGSYYRKNKLDKTFPKAFLWQPLRPASSLLESVLLLLRFKFWHFEINRKQRDFFLYFFIYSFTKTRWKHFNQACRGPDTGDGGDRSVMSGALPGVPLEPRLFSPTSNSANLPTLSTVADYINSPKYVFGEKTLHGNVVQADLQCYNDFFFFLTFRTAVVFCTSLRAHLLNQL